MDIAIVTSQQIKVAYPSLQDDVTSSSLDSLKEKLKIGEIIEGEIKEIVNKDMAIINLKGFNLWAKHSLLLRKNQRILAEIKALEPEIRIKLINNHLIEEVSDQCLSSNTLSKGEKSYFTTLYQILPGIESVEFKMYYNSNLIQTFNMKDIRLEILLDMSKLGFVLIKIKKNFLHVDVENQEIKKLVENNKVKLEKRLKKTGLCPEITINYCYNLNETFHNKKWIDLKI